MNLLPLAPRGAALVVAGTDGPVLAAADCGAATVGIRPELLRIGGGGLPAVVTHAEYLGADTVLACRVGEAPRVLARLPGHVRIAEGTALQLGFDPDAVHLFAAGSGRRIAAGAPVLQTA
jgi:sn-glycerol 3-phosphate transport system ATP-binding protein